MILVIAAERKITACRYVGLAYDYKWIQVARDGRVISQQSEMGHHGVGGQERESPVKSMEGEADERGENLGE